MTKQNIAGKLASFFIAHPLTLISAVFILSLGYLSLEFMPREENPQIKVAGGAVIVPMPGAKADEIQKIIIEPLEKKIRQIKGVENIFSIARDSVGIVQVQYLIGQDKGASDLKLYDQVMKNMDEMPKTAMQPIIKTMDIDVDIPVCSVAFYSKDKNMSEVELYKRVNRLAFDINKMDDVAQIDLKGEKKEQYNILVDSDKLIKKRVTLGQVAMALKGLTFELPDIKAEKKDGTFVVFGIDNALQTSRDLGNVIVDRYVGRPVLLKDIATISKGYDIQHKQEARIYDKQNSLVDKSQVTMTISKLKGANTVVINEKIVAHLNSIKEKLSDENIGFVITRDDGYTANHAVNELVFHLVLSVLIIAVLLVFALGFKEAMIVSITVPMILSLTLFVGFLMGETINRITLFALLLSLGLLVDAAIIVIENIHRHMNDPKYKEHSLEKIAIDATNEIGNPTNIATIAIVMTFIPMFFVGGMMGQFMHPLPVFVPIALLVSLVVAYMYTPYMVAKILKKKEL